MDVDKYRSRLQELERKLSSSTSGRRAAARAQRPDSPGDEADESVVNESESEDFTEAELDASVLEQVRAALQRIDDGTYGRCLEDGQPIPEARLDAVPWAPYCAKHQAMLESASGRRLPTM
jgi:RNA polymerase-binding transcription factor DksA